MFGKWVFRGVGVTDICGVSAERSRVNSVAVCGQWLLPGRFVFQSVCPLVLTTGKVRAEGAPDLFVPALQCACKPFRVSELDFGKLLNLFLAG